MQVKAKSCGLQNSTRQLLFLTLLDLLLLIFTFYTKNLLDHFQLVSDLVLLTAIFDAWSKSILIFVYSMLLPPRYCLIHDGC